MKMRVPCRRQILWLGSFSCRYGLAGDAESPGPWSPPVSLHPLASELAESDRLQDARKASPKVPALAPAGKEAAADSTDAWTLARPSHLEKPVHSGDR